MDAKDSNGNTLTEGDSVQVIKDLKVKGSSSSLALSLLNIHLKGISAFTKSSLRSMSSLGDCAKLNNLLSEKC